MTSEDACRAYVDAALALQGYAFDEATRRAVAAQFMRIEAIARSFLDVELPPDAEPAALFQP